MIAAAAETRISVVEFDLVGCFAWDDGDVALAAGGEGSAAEAVAAWGGGSCACGGVVSTKRGGAMLGGTFLGRTSLGGTVLGGTVAVRVFWSGIGLVGTAAVGTFWGGTGIGGTGLGVVSLDGIWRVASREISGALGRGT